MTANADRKFPLFACPDLFVEGGSAEEFWGTLSAAGEIAQWRRKIARIKLMLISPSIHRRSSL